MRLLFVCVFLICLIAFMAQLKYPSALYCFGQIVKHASNKKIAIFLDYDGTLSPIVDDPDRALMSDAVRIVFMNFFFLSLSFCF